jgi:hypothetical protein
MPDGEFNELAAIALARLYRLYKAEPVVELLEI